MLFQADLPNGSPPLELKDLRPGMKLDVWNGRAFQTMVVTKMQVAVGDQIRVIDSRNSPGPSPRS